MRDNATTLITILLTGLLLPEMALASGQIELKTIAQQEIKIIDDLGRETTRLVEAARVVPGDEVIYTITARNIADEPVEHVVIIDPIPEHMTYVDGSALGEECKISFSIDGGKSFHPSESLLVTDESGLSRPAKPEDYTDIRWTLEGDMPASSTKSVSFRARLD